MWGETKARRALVTTAGAAAAVLALGSGATAQPVLDPDFGDAQACVTADLGNTLLVVNVREFTPVVPVALPAGTIHIPEVVSWDEYPDRGTVTQASERWEIQFLDAGGNVVAVSEATPDIPDGVRRGEYIGPLPSVELPVDAAGIRARHRPDLPFDGAPSSVYASGVTLCWDEAPAPPPPPTCPPDDEGNVPEPDEQGACPLPLPPSTPTTPTTPPLTCPPDADGNPQEPAEDGSCPPDGPQITEPPCLDAAGNPQTRNPDGSCGTTTTPTTEAPPLGPSISAPGTGGGRLPVTGSESTILFLSGLWLLAAGTTATLFVRFNR